MFIVITCRDIHQGAQLNNKCATGTIVQRKVEELERNKTRMVKAATSRAARSGDTHDAVKKLTPARKRNIQEAAPHKGLGVREGVSAACILLDVTPKSAEPQ